MLWTFIAAYEKLKLLTFDLTMARIHWEHEEHMEPSQRNMEPHYSEHDLWISSITSIWQLVREANSESLLPPM